MAGMYIQYGSYQHPPGEANLMHFSVKPFRSARHFKETSIVTAHVAGDICLQPGQTVGDTSSKVSDLIDALSVDGEDFGLYLEDGTPTPHFMFGAGADSLTGNQIVGYDFPASHNGEFTTGRSFQYTVSNTFLSAERTILDYSETIQHFGTGGPITQWQNNRYFEPTYSLLYPSSIQTIRQSGYSVGVTNWLLPPSPILGFPYEQLQMRRITRQSPRRFPLGFIGYTTQWDYVFHFPGSFPAFPGII
jgi:hypothetical protein